MKKTVSNFLYLMMCLSLLASCSTHTGDSTDTFGNTAADISEPQDAALPGVGTSEANSLPAGEQFHTKVYEEGTTVVRYISITGLPDEGVQNILNENIKDFFLWQWLYKAPDAEPDEHSYNGAAEYHVVGGRFLSVVQRLDIYPEEHPTVGDSDTTPKRINAQTFDLTTGEPAAELVFGGAAYRMSNSFYKFSQVYPDGDDDAAKSTFHDLMQDNEFIYNYFLTEECLAVFFENENRDDYFIFEAPYEAIPEMLSQSLVNAIEEGGK